MPTGPPTPLDRVIDYANAKRLSVRWEKFAPGRWEVRIETTPALCGYGVDIQDAARNLLEDRLGAKADAEASKLAAK